MNEGDEYFVWASTIGMGTIPFLPDELRRKIFVHTFPRIHARCARCASSVMLKSLQNTLFQSRPFTRVDDSFCCLECIGKNASVWEWGRRVPDS